MRRLILKSLLLALPFALVAGAVAWVDPFDYFPWNAARQDPARQDIAYRMSAPLAKLARFRGQPAAHVLLGDSRMASLDAAAVSRAAGAEVANLAYGGGSLEEAIRTFWYADRLVALRSVTVGVNIELYSETNAKDRVSTAEAILASPALYLFDRVVMRTAWMVFERQRTGKAPVIGVPPMDPDAFWRYQLDVTARIAADTHRHPEGYRRRLAEIAAHCREKGIRLRFVIFPEHRDLRAVAARHGLEPEVARMKSDLAAIAETVDLAGIVDEGDRSRFVDPYHFDAGVAADIVERVWGAEGARSR